MHHRISRGAAWLATAALGLSIVSGPLPAAAAQPATGCSPSVQCWLTELEHPCSKCHDVRAAADARPASTTEKTSPSIITVCNIDNLFPCLINEILALPHSLCLHQMCTDGTARKN